MRLGLARLYSLSPQAFSWVGQPTSNGQIITYISLYKPESKRLERGVICIYGIISGTTIVVIKGDTRRWDYSTYVANLVSTIGTLIPKPETRVFRS